MIPLHSFLLFFRRNPLDFPMKTLPEFAAAVEAANAHVAAYCAPTPLLYSQALSQRTGAKVYLKLEALQPTGSFKVRGALHKLACLSPAMRQGGVITASTGNHAAAVAFALAQLGGRATIFMPENTAAVKREALAHYPHVTLSYYGTDSADTERYARTLAEQQGKPYLSPYNDWDLVAGQGTVAHELHRQLPTLAAVFVPIGGGGLISGIAGYLKHHLPNVAVIGCQPAHSATMYHSLRAGEILETPHLPTLSDGTAGGIEADALTFTCCQKWVDDVFLVSEQELFNALRILLEEEQLLVEGAAALSVATLLKHAANWRAKEVVLILCGRKLPMETLKKLLATHVGE